MYLRPSIHKHLFNCFCFFYVHLVVLLTVHRHPENHNSKPFYSIAVPIPPYFAQILPLSNEVLVTSKLGGERNFGIPTTSLYLQTKSAIVGRIVALHVVVHVIDIALAGGEAVGRTVFPSV